MKNWAFICVICVLVSSCTHKLNVSRIDAARPQLAPTAFRLDSLPVSEINVPIQVNLKPIYAMAEKSVDTVFNSPNYPDDWVYDGCSVRYKYTFRRGPLQMKAAGNALTLGFTGYYRIIGSTRGCVAGIAFSPWTAPCRCGFDEAERRVTLSFTNSATILPDYKIKMNFVRNEPKAIDKCEVCFWNQDITTQVLNGIKTELDASRSDLEKNYGLVDLKSRFQQVWDQLNQVYSLYGMGWLQINPQRLRINGLFAKNDSLNVVLGLSAQPVISFEKPAEKGSWIPPLADFGNRSGFNIFLDAVLHYDSLTNILNAQVRGKEFDFNKGPVRKKFVIKECKLMGAGNERIIIRVDFGGTDNGTFYLLGKPVYDAARKMLEVRDIDFDIQSKDALLKAADWLFSKKITAEISKYARYDLSSYLDSAKTMLNQQINQEWIKGIRSSGSINSLGLIGIYPMEKHLVIRSNCTGNLSVSVESIPFSL